MTTDELLERGEGALAAWGKSVDELRAALQKATDGMILAAVAGMTGDREYVENATDGNRLRATVQFFATRGRDGDIQSSHLVQVAAGAMAEYMGQPLPPKPHGGE